MTELTTSQKRALVWLKARNGTGIFDRDHVLVAAGAHGPFQRGTWNALRDAGFIRIEGNRLTMEIEGYSEASRVATEREVKGAEHDITERDSILYGEDE